MKPFKYDFKRYRSYECMVVAMEEHCQLKRGIKGRHKGICPRPDCTMKHKRTLVLYHRNQVAFCYACNRSIDALDIVKCATGQSLHEACEELEFSCNSFLPCHT